MAKRPHQSDIQPYWEINEEQHIPQHHSSKLPSTTRYTQPQNHFNLGNSFIIGKNDLVENNTASELDSSDAESDISFQQRLNCRHEKHLLRQINKYLQAKGVFGPNSSLHSQSGSKSTELMKDIEERVFDDIKRFHGNNEVEKIKLTLRFIKRNESLTRIYFEVVKSLPQSFQAVTFFLLKHSVIMYLEGRQTIGEENHCMSEGIIKDYIVKNIENITQEVIKDEKMQALFNGSQEAMLRKKFTDFLGHWMEGFFMAKEGYPCSSFYETESNTNTLVGMRQGTMEREKRKKIKKF